jgi:hypothetical protein
MVILGRVEAVNKTGAANETVARIPVLLQGEFD